MPYIYKVERRSYQRNYAKLLYKVKRLLAAWEMGTGKTKFALDFMGVLFFHKKLSSALVIAPLSALSVWEDEIAKNWDEGLDVTYTVLRPGTKQDWKKCQLVLTNYDYARVIIGELQKWAPEMVVLDESHKIKNPHAKQSKMAHRLGNICRYALCLTGTPIGNHPLDLWSQFKFLVPGLLEEKFKDFKERYCIFGGGGGYEIRKYRNLPELSKKIHPYVRSLKKKDHLDLPEKNFIEIPVEMGEKARKMYASMEKDFIAYITKEKVINAPIALAKLTKLSQISGGFIRNTEDKEDFPVHRAKLEVLNGICDDLREADNKRVVIFARFLWEIKEIRQMLAPTWTTYEISGNVSVEERKLANSLFNESGGAMICQTVTGSTALNLQTCNYTIFYSLNYSHIDFSQGQDRTHRMGQSKPCFYYMLLSKGTLDRKIYRILKEKRNVAESMIDLVKAAQKEARCP